MAGHRVGRMRRMRAARRSRQRMRCCCGASERQMGTQGSTSRTLQVPDYKILFLSVAISFHINIARSVLTMCCHMCRFMAEWSWIQCSDSFPPPRPHQLQCPATVSPYWEPQQCIWCCQQWAGHSTASGRGRLVARHQVVMTGSVASVVKEGAKECRKYHSKLKGTHLGEDNLKWLERPKIVVLI